jgi:hypothetical protein
VYRHHNDQRSSICVAALAIESNQVILCMPLPAMLAINCRALEQLLADKQLSPSDSQQAWDELQRMRGVMGQAQEQQQALQQMYNQQQHQPPPDQKQQQQQQQGAPQVRSRDRRGVQMRPQQPQQQQPQQEHSWLSQQHSTLCVSSQPLDVEQQQQLGASCEELPGDSLDAFMVETQMVSGNKCALYVCSCVSSRVLAMHWLVTGCLHGGISDGERGHYKRVPHICYVSRQGKFL